MTKLLELNGMPRLKISFPVTNSISIPFAKVLLNVSLEKGMLSSGAASIIIIFFIFLFFSSLNVPSEIPQLIQE